MSFEMASANEAATQGPPSGSYNAVVIDVTEPEQYAYNADEPEKWVARWVFQIESDPEWDGYEMRSNRINLEAKGEKATRIKLLKALFASEFDPDHRYLLKESIGRRCQIVVTVNDRGYSDVTGFLELRKPRQGVRSMAEATGQQSAETIPF
jgi:hypothetical protein